MKHARFLFIAAAGGVLATTALAVGAPNGAPDVSVQHAVVENLRKLRPQGTMVRVGNFPGGAAVTPDGRYYWTVSAGYTENGVEIVSTRTAKVVQRLQVPGASGGVALDGAHRLAYVSGEPETGIKEAQAPKDAPGKKGDVIHVLSWSAQTGEAQRVKVIPVPPPSGSPGLDAFPPTNPGETRSWPERLAVSPDGRTLLVALGLADRAAVIDTQTNAVRYVATGSHPFGAAILPDGKTGLVSNRGPGTVSVIDLKAAKKVKDIQAGPHLSHPEAIELSPDGHRAFVPLANDDAVAVIDTDKLAVERRLSVRHQEGPGAAPVQASATPDGTQLLVADAHADDISVFALPGGAAEPWSLLGRIPTAAYPVDVRALAQTAGIRCQRQGQRRPRKTCAKLLWTTAKGFGLGPNPGLPDPNDPARANDVPAKITTKGLVTGYVGIDDLPTAKRLPGLTAAATAQLAPATREDPPAGTPLRSGGPIKHVFYIVKENRTYDQVLGDEPRGDGDPRYALFGQKVTPNLHALVQRFPLLDRVYANSEASIDGHYWTAAADNSDYVHRTWRQNYAGRKYPSDAWFFQIAFPQNGFLFDRADQQGVTWTNLGEGVVHLNPLPDRDRNAQDNRGVLRRFSKSDLGALTPGGCYDPFIGNDEIAGAGGVPIRLYDSSLPAGAPTPSLSRFDCFRDKFRAWEATDTLPQLVYLTLPNDHTVGPSPGRHTPRAMVADNDLGLGQIIDLISHSRYWAQSAFFVVEDDSQDGMDHHDAHRIPALVAGPYAKQGAVVHTAYDMLSVIRSIELILGLKPLNLFDAQATPMYDAFDAQPSNAAPFDALAPTWSITEQNPPTPTSAAAREAARHDMSVPDHISQRLLDTVLWKSVHGPRSTPPPPGPNATPEPRGG